MPLQEIQRVKFIIPSKLCYLYIIYLPGNNRKLLLVIAELSLQLFHERGDMPEIPSVAFAKIV